jgi:hypothetical protein
MSLGRRVFPPNRLATSLRHAIAEILQRPNPPRRNRSYPRVTKRTMMSKFPRKQISHNNIRHKSPPEVRLMRFQT